MQAFISRILQEHVLHILLTVSGVFLAIALAYGSGRLGGLFVSENILKLPLPQTKLPPLPNEESSLSDIGFSDTYFKDILDQNVFDAAMSPQEIATQLQPEVVPEAIEEGLPAEPTPQIDFKLYGTVVLINSAYAWLSMEAINNALIFRLNDCFSAVLEFAKECTDDTFKLVKIEKKRVAILVKEKELWLDLSKEGELVTTDPVPEKTKPVAPSPPAPSLSQPEPQEKVAVQVEAPQPQADSQQEVFQIQRVWVDEQLANFGQILQDARVIPEIKDETTLFKFDWIKEDSMYSRLGLKEGDIILSINDIIIDNISKAMGLLNKLQSEREIELEVEREGKRKLLQYYIN